MTTKTRHPLCTDRGTHYPHAFPVETAEGRFTVTCDGADTTMWEVHRMSEHVILVAFQVTADSREEAEQSLLMVLPRPKGLPRGDMPGHGFLECWWVAEDDRHDGSDNDSAVFVHPGAARVASALLFKAGLTNGCNLITRPPAPQFEEPV